MENTELRIGNWCQTKEEGYCQIINGWQLDEGYELFPIPLTPEMLEKCGFKKETRGNYSSSWNVYLMENFNLHQSGGFANPQYWKITTVYNCPPIIHLHQLQNLYFALTGEELKIEL